MQCFPETCGLYSNHQSSGQGLFILIPCKENSWVWWHSSNTGVDKTGGDFFIIFAFWRQYISLVTILKKKKGKKKKASTKSYTLAGSLENMPVIQARYPFLFLKACLVCFLLFVFIKKGHLISFHVDLMAFLTYEMEMVARVIASLPSKVVLRIHWERVQDLRKSATQGVIDTY